MDLTGPFYIDSTVTFTCNTHLVAGSAQDADDLPEYRVYEDETGTPILTGTLSKLDDANTVGFYSEQIILSLANGFEQGKSYTVYISAIVDSVPASKSGTFKIVAQSVALGAGSSTYTITIEAPTGTPRPGVDVWVATDLAGTNVIARGTTNAFGVVIFLLDPGTYYVYKQLEGYDFTNPETIIVA